MSTEHRPAWPWRCPDCGAALPQVDGAGSALPCPLPCDGCGRVFVRREGLADLRPTATAAMVERFASEYAAVRQAEGRGAITVDDLRALPWPGPDTPMAWEWLIRSASYEAVLDGVLRARPASDEAMPRALDLGAGVGWLSHRLAWEGWHALALDACPDRHVGLGAAQDLLDLTPPAGVAETADGSMTLALADFNSIPLADGGFDLVVFNASLHYSPDLSISLREAARMLAPGGLVAVIDSPFYEDPAAGQAMAAARRADFQARFGNPSDAQGGVDYLTRRVLADAGEAAGLRWRYLLPRHGWRWTLRRAWRRLRLGRESAAFPVALGERR